MLRRLLSMLLIVAIMLPSALFADPAKAQEYYNDAALEYEKGNYKKAAELLDYAYAEDPILIYVYNRILALQAAGEYKEALKELDKFENRMITDPEKRFEDIPKVKTQLEERIALEEKKDNNNNTNNNNTNNSTNTNNNTNGQIEDPGETPETKRKGPGIVAISLLAGGGLLLGAGGLISTGVFFSEKTQHDDSVETIEDFKSDRISFAEYESQLIAIWGTDTGTQAIGKYDDAVSTLDSQKVISIILMATGGALVVGGVIAWVVNISSDSGGSDEAPTSADAIQISPVVGPNGVGAALKFEF